ncbi:MAG: efflux RND transporter periplasmic adaptor subunit [Planctomycetes bacterium]|nr:efflux RND transporter periplasmic adaptor subunit [Planctomycetota bacterium]
MKYIFYGGLVSIIVGVMVTGIIVLSGNHIAHDGQDRSQSRTYAGHQAAPIQPEQKESTKQLYHCPMHPTYISDKPGDCPICGMKLVPIKEDGQSSTGSVAGQATVSISPQQEHLIGVKTEMVMKRDLTPLIRVSGRVAYDPELYIAIAEYRSAVANKQESLINSTSLRLRQLGLSEEQIKQLPKAKDEPSSLLLPGATVWIYANIYEYEIGLVQPGQTITATSMALPGREFSGTIKAIDPILNKETRSLRVRAEVANSEGLFKPEMYVDVTINVALGNKLAMPDSAVLDTGTRQLVFVKTGPGRYEPRQVKLGQSAEGYREALDGVAEMEEVVTSANFFIDSESKLKSAISTMGSGHKHGTTDEHR